MPRRRAPLPPEALARHEFDAEMQQAINEIATELGPAEGVAPASDKDKVRQWGIRDQMVDYDAMVHRLMTTGYPPEMLDPESENALMVVRENPDLASMYGQPTQDPEMAGVLAALAEWPFRIGMLRDLEDDPEAQAKESDRIDALWQKTLPPVNPLMQEPAPMPAPQMSQPMAPQQPPVMPQPQAAPMAPVDMPAELPGTMPQMPGQTVEMVGG